MRWRRRDQEPTLDEKLEHLEAQLHVLEAVVLGMHERSTVLQELDAASSVDDAIVRLGERLGLDELQARVAMDMQLRRLVPAEIAKADEQLRELRELRESCLRRGAKPR